MRTLSLRELSVDHMDGDKHNNNAYNLQLATPRLNKAYALGICVKAQSPGNDIPPLLFVQLNILMRVLDS